MASPVATVTTSPFLVTATARTLPQAKPEPTVVTEEAPKFEAGSIAAWQASLGGATGVLRSATKAGGDVTVLHASRNAVQSSLVGAVAALSDRLRATEEGVAACELLTTVTSAYDALAAASAPTIDRQALANMVADFKARIADAEKCWTKQGKVGRHEANYVALAREVVAFPALSQMVTDRRRSAQGTPGWGGALTEYRRFNERVLADLERAFGIFSGETPALLPVPQGSVRAEPLVPQEPVAPDVIAANRKALVDAFVDLDEAIDEFKTRMAKAATQRNLSTRGERYVQAYTRLAEDLAPLPALAAMITRRRVKARTQDTWEEVHAAFQRTTPRVLAEVERQLGVGASANAVLLPPPPVAAEEG